MAHGSSRAATGARTRSPPSWVTILSQQETCLCQKSWLGASRKVSWPSEMASGRVPSGRVSISLWHTILHPPFRRQGHRGPSNFHSAAGGTEKIGSSTRRNAAAFCGPW